MREFLLPAGSHEKNLQFRALKRLSISPPGFPRRQSRLPVAGSRLLGPRHRKMKKHEAPSNLRADYQRLHTVDSYIHNNAMCIEIESFPILTSSQHTAVRLSM
jgi:hypothetical protein